MLVGGMEAGCLDLLSRNPPLCHVSTPPEPQLRAIGLLPQAPSWSSNPQGCQMMLRQMLKSGPLTLPNICTPPVLLRLLAFHVSSLPSVLEISQPYKVMSSCIHLTPSESISRIPHVSCI